MEVQEVILRAIAKKITWWQAAEIIGISDWHTRRRRALRGVCFSRLFDRRRGKPSPKPGHLHLPRTVCCCGLREFPEKEDLRCAKRDLFYVTTETR
jgi:hypothetical protein